MDQATKLREMMMVHDEKIAKVITIASAKYGVGKTRILVNLAIALSRLGKRVVILDASLETSNTEAMLGITPKLTLADSIFEGKSLKDTIIRDKNGIGFISGGLDIYEINKLSYEQLMCVIKKLSELDNEADILIVDTGAGISKLILEFIYKSSEILLITTPETTVLKDTYALLKVLDRERKKDLTIKIISNKVLSYKDGEKLYEKLHMVVDRFLSLNIDYMGTVLQDSEAIFSKEIIDMANRL